MILHFLQTIPPELAYLALAVIVVLTLISLFRTGYPDNSNRSLRK